MKEFDIAAKVHRVRDKIEELQMNFWSLKYLHYLTDIICSILICLTIKNLTDYDNEIYQTLKDAALARAMLAFLSMMFIIRKVRPFNLFSLFSVGVWYIARKYYLLEMINSPEVLLSRRPWSISALLILLILIDAFRYHKFEQLRVNKPLLVILYCGATFWMLKYSHGTPEGTVMLVAFGTLFTTPLTKAEWNNLVKRLCDGWFFVSVWLIGRALLYHYPYDTERFYGGFTNIGPFGIFLLCSLMISGYGLYFFLRRIKRGKGRWDWTALLHPVLWIDLIWMAFILIVINMTRTVTMFIGIGFICLVLYFVTARNKKSFFIRLAIFLVAMVGLVFAFRYVYNNAAEIYFKLGDKFAENPNNYFIYLCLRIALGIYKGVDYTYLYEVELTPFWGILDSISSARIYIWKVFSEYFNFTGNAPNGIQIDNYYHYFAYSAHCEYVQTIYRYGYLGGGMNIALYVCGMVYCAVEYIKGKEKVMLFSVVWLAGMLGVWSGEGMCIMYPVTFTGLILMYPAMIRCVDRDVSC